MRAQIVHVDLSTTPATFVGTDPLYWFIFWYGDRPVGQLELASTPGETLDPARLGADTVPAETLAEARAALKAEALATRPARRISVVICTRDRPEELARCLASFSEQTRVPDEIIVVDNASRDGRSREAAEAAGVVYVREDRPGLDIARNTGALAATGAFILYTDDDVILHPRWAERMVAAFDGGVDAVTGLVLPAELESEAQLHFERYWGFGKGFRRTDFGKDFFAADQSSGCPAWEIGAGASMAFRSEVFREVGLFDERLDVGAAGCSGDSEYWHRLLTHGRSCRYDPGIVAFHFHRRDLAGLRKQLRAYMRGHSTALLVQYERSRNRGNMRRLLIILPRLFIGRALRIRGEGLRTRLLMDEVAGYIGGVRFYLRNRKPPAGPSVRPPAAMC